MRRARFVLTILLSAAGCGAAGPDPTKDDPQAEALAALERDTGAPWRVRYHEDVHTPAFLEGRTAPLITTPNMAVRAARSFFGSYGALFKMVSPDAELAEDVVESDELGMTHVRFLQSMGGVTVYGREMSAHFDSGGVLIRIHGRFSPLDAIDTTPLISEEDALTAAEATVATASVDGTPPKVESGRPQLFVDPGVVGAMSRLAWVVDLRVDDPAAPLHREIFVDARSGLPYRLLDELDTITGSGRGVFGETLSLNLTTRRGRYFLEDEGSGSPAQRTYSFTNNNHLPGVELASSALDQWDDAGPGAGAAVDAHAYMTIAYSYFGRVHGRDGALGDGAGMRATVHFGEAFNNAFWNGKQLVFGDGDGVEFAPLSGGLDVVAHEYTHAVTQGSSRLGHAEESGALNEAISDLFGTFIEHDARGNGANWIVGEDVYIAGGPLGLRDLGDPHRTNNPAHLDEKVVTSDDRGGIHVNSTVVSHAGYLMTVGGMNSVSKITVSGIGLAMAEKVWYRALTRYLHPSSNFSDIADATVAAARDLFEPGAQSSAVQRAWQAVGVLPEP